MVAVVGVALAFRLTQGPGDCTSDPSSAGCEAAAPRSSPTATATPTVAQVKYPDRSTTGVPPGVTLRASDRLTINVAGTVVDRLDVRGVININAPDVVVRRSRVSGSAYNVINIKEGLSGVRIEDVEVDGLGLAGKPGSSGITGPATIVRARIWGVENGIKPFSGSVVQDSMISDLAAPGSPHVDGIEIDQGSDITVKGNFIDMSNWGQTSTIMIDNYFGPASRIRVEGNRLLGGGYTVYSDARFKGGPITDISFVDNRMGKGQWGYAAIRDSDPVWLGNVDDATGLAIPR